MLSNQLIDFIHIVCPLQGLNTAEIGLGGWNTWIDEDILEQSEDAAGSDDENGKQQLIKGVCVCVHICKSIILYIINAKSEISIHFCIEILKETNFENNFETVNFLLYFKVIVRQNLYTAYYT